MSSDFVEDAILARAELEEIAEEYRLADEKEKAADKAKKKLKPALLELITEVAVEEVPPATIIERVSVDDAATFDPDRWRILNYPEYEIVHVELGEKGEFVVELREDPSLRKYTFTVGGYTFGRTIAMVGSSFDAEAFLAEAPEDWKHIIKERVVYELDEEAARELMSSSPEAVPMLQKYSSPGYPQVRLNPIRKAKDEENE